MLRLDSPLISCARASRRSENVLRGFSRMHSGLFGAVGALRWSWRTHGGRSGDELQLQSAPDQPPAGQAGSCSGPESALAGQDSLDLMWSCSFRTGRHEDSFISLEETRSEALRQDRVPEANQTGVCAESGKSVTHCWTFTHTPRLSVKTSLFTCATFKMLRLDFHFYIKIFTRIKFSNQIKCLVFKRTGAWKPSNPKMTYFVQRFSRTEKE